MKRKLWIFLAVAAVALIALWPRTAPVASTDLAHVTTLQEVVNSADGLDATTSRSPCRVCAKDPTRCLQTCALEHCAGGCN